MPNEFKIHYRQVDGLENQFFVSGYFCFNRGNSSEAKIATNLLLKNAFYRSLSENTAVVRCFAILLVIMQHD